MPSLGAQVGIWIRSDNGFSHDPIPHPYRFQTPAALVANHIFAAISDATRRQNQLLYRLNLFGGKNAMPKPKDSPDFDRNGPGMGPREGGKKGFGGGRPAGGPPSGGGFGGF